MRNKAQCNLAGLATIVLCLGVAVIVQAGEPLELVKTAADKAIRILQEPKLKAPDKKQERVERLQEIVKPIFDYEEMAKRSLGAHWRRRAPAERSEFTKLFQDYLEKIYADRIDLYEGERVVFGKETIEGDYAEVASVMINGKGEQTSVVYRFKRSDGKWKVYDAVVADISIVNNYRSQFDRVISKSSFQELKKILKEKGG